MRLPGRRRGTCRPRGRRARGSATSSCRRRPGARGDRAPARSGQRRGGSARSGPGRRSRIQRFQVSASTTHGLLFELGLAPSDSLSVRSAAALSSSRAQPARRCSRTSAARCHFTRSSFVTRNPIVLLGMPLADLGAGPRPPPGHPVPRAMAGGTSSSWRFGPAYGVLCAHPPRSAGHCTSPPSLSSPIQWVGIARER